MPYEVAVSDQKKPVLQMWYSEHVERYRWVLTFGNNDQDVFHGNATTVEQAMGDVEHCRMIYQGKIA